MKPDKFLYCSFLLSFLALAEHKTQIVQGRGLSNLNLGIFVCTFDVCRTFKPVPSINYGLVNVLCLTKSVLQLIFLKRCLSTSFRS